MKLGLISTLKSESFGNPDPPMGLVSIATYLKQHMNIDIGIIDNNFDDVVNTVIKYNPDIVGISAKTIFYNRAIEFGKKIKEELNIPVIIGGVHVTTLPSSFSNIFDLGVIGEGEQTMLELMQIYEKYGKFPKEQLKKIKGLIYFNGGKLVATEKRELIEPLDSLPVMDRSFLNKEYFKSRWIGWDDKNGIEASIITARGCPYRCVFCSTSVFWQRVRFNSPQHVFEEVNELVEKYNVSHIAILDDLFTINKGRLKEIAELFKQNGITDKVSFFCQARTNTIDDEMCKILKELNIKTLNFGFESGSDRILRYLKRESVTIENHKKAVLLANKYNFKLEGSFIFGSPTETIEDMKKTLEFIEFIKNNVKRACVWNFVMTPFPATHIWEVAKERGKVKDDMNFDELNHYNVDNPMLLEPSVNRKEFKKIFLEANAKADQMKMKSDWLRKKLKYDTPRLIKQVVINPKRAVKFLFNTIQTSLKK